MRSFPAAALIALGALSAGPVLASWPYDPAVGVPVCTAASGQTSVVATGDGDGGAILCWVDHRAGRYDLYAQRVDHSGASLWGSDGLLVQANAGTFSFPLVASDGAGGAIVVWPDARGGNFDLYGQRLDASGAARWSAGGVPLAVAPGDQIPRVVIADGSGGAFVAWSDTRVSPSGDVYAQHVDATGAIGWGSSGAAACTATNAQSPSGLALDGAGGVIVVWSDLRNGTDLDIYAQRLSSFGVADWPADGLAISTALNDQRNPTMVSDGYGGALIAWEDERNGLNLPDVYAQRVSSTGSLMWGTNAIALAQVQGSQQLPQSVSDGSGGMIVVWQTDHISSQDIYAQRVTGAGVQLWGLPQLGAVITSFSGDQTAPVIAGDGQGGAIIAWQDHRGSDSDIYARRISGAGQVQGTLGGIPLSTAVGDQTGPAIVDDGRGGAILAWTDARSGSGDIYAERFDGWSVLGDPAPGIVSARDVPNDQGGHLTLTWSASDRDASAISSYRIWRSVPPQNPGLSSAVRSRPVTSDPEVAMNTGALLQLAGATDGYAWEFVDKQYPGGGATRTYDITTTCDSLPDSNPYTAFMVEAFGNLLETWFSYPDSGYSVDNFPPLPAATFQAYYGPGFTHLSWSPSVNSDFGVYRLYRGASPDFAISPASLLASQPDTGYVDVTATAWYYKLTLVDIHGNESSAQLVNPPSQTAVGTAPALSFALAPPRPNPARSNLTLGFALPAAGSVRLELFDLAGRRVCRWLNGAAAAGAHALQVRLVADDGRPLAAGLYLVRLESRAGTLTRRLAVTP
ncbi:MAG TPA: T9SS type A sorting domain-containing protein [Candidatus Sulfotelmatobacter sp.]|nr:T9SS type A sorting domain-containing protein [Candidatus Sulfotelmatobacter sp.]